MRWPVDSPIFGSPYGNRYHPTLHYWRLHAGQDFPNAPGTPLRAIAAGRVSANVPVRRNPGGGNFVQITLDDGAKARYFHMSYPSHLHVGTRVHEGQIVGYLGNTGTWTTGPHLHFEIKIGARTVDPREYISARLTTMAGTDATPLGPDPTGENVFVAIRNGSYYLIIPNGGKQSAIPLGREDITKDVPVVRFNWDESWAVLKQCLTNAGSVVD